MPEKTAALPRRTLLAGAGALLAGTVWRRPAAVATAAAMPVEMFRTSGCSCCLLWANHLRAAGFTVTVKELASGALMRMKLEAGLKSDQLSCHTAFVGGYVIEGHVPAEDVRRLLAEKPSAAGLTVPGMPIGSPGMEAGNRREAYQVLLFQKDGAASTFTSYAARG
jgi:hypothetical protein